MEFNAWLRSKGIDPDELTPTTEKSLKTMWQAETAALQAGAATATQANATQANSNVSPNVSQTTASNQNASTGAFDDIVAAQRREQQRVNDITTMVARAMEECPAQLDAIEQVGREALRNDGRDGRPLTTVEQANLYLLRVSRGAPNITTLHIPSAPELNARVLEAAVCKAGGLKSVEKDFSDQTLSAADKHFRGGIGLKELIGIGARSRGFRGSVDRDLRRAMRHAFRDFDDGPMSAGVGTSTIDVGGILSNVANKFVREQWMFVESVWRSFTAIRSVKDFKQITSYSLTGNLTYKEIPAGGKLEHGTLGDESYTNQAKSYGIIIGLDRRDLINDDLGAFTGLGRRLGRGGALKFNNVFWTAFLDNSTFFTAQNGNYDDGTDTAFGLDGLTAAEVIWDAMTDPDSEPMGHTPKFLLVPPAHKVVGARLMDSPTFGDNGDKGTANPHAGKYELLSSRYMANSNYTGYSTKAWYLLCDPNDTPVIEACFYNGNEMPTVETVELDGDQLGMAMRAYHDFGVTKQEKRGGLKLKGEA